MKTKSIILLVAVLFVMVMSFTSCNIFHKHEWTDATCTTPKTCLTCGKTEGEALGHAEKVLEGKNATCTATGLTEGKKCSICGEITLAQETIPVKAHTEVKLDGKAATCTEAGLSEGKKCSACGEITVKQETIPAAGHKEEALAAKAPTCTETGLTAGKKCSECDIVLEAQSTVPATGHKYDDEYDATCNNEGCDFVRDAACRHTNTEVLAAEAATCTKTGLTEGLKCKDCEEILTNQEIVPMIAHSWTLATCTAPKTCSVCELTEGDALGHNWKPATCTDPKTCQRENCGATEGEALGHKWKDATCTAPQICSVCTATQGEALGHDWKDATCEAPKTCSVCKATEGSKLGHSYNDATYVWSEDNTTCTATKVCKNDPSHVVTESGKVDTQTVSATCITAGTVTYTATFTEDGFAKQTKSENVDKLPHVYGTTSYDWSDDYRSCTAVKKCTGDNCYANVSETVTSTIVTVDSTCTVKGSVTYTVDFKNAEFEDQTYVEYLPLAKHNLVSHSKPATCTETGLTEILKCTNCSYTEGTQEEIPLQPHTYDDSNGYATECSVCHTPRPACKHESLETISGYEATCSKEGLTDGKKCKTCGETVVGQTTIPKAEHTPGAAATCTEDQICTVCKVTLNKATDHSFGKVNYEWIYNGDKIVACKATRTCQNSCGTSENETVNAESKIVSEVACEKAGTKTYTAVFSNSAFKTQTKDVTIPALEHSYTSVVTDPTCTTGGYTTYTCSKCKDSYTDDETTKLGHSFTNYKSNNDATCLADGTKTAKCERCDVTDTVADPGSAKGHSFTKYVSNNDATCTADGTKTATCDRCDVTDTTTDVGSKLAHTYDKNIAENEYLKSAATCTAEAVYYKSCSSCGAFDVEKSGTFKGTTVDSTNHTGTEVSGGTADVHTKYSCCGATISNTHEYSSKITTLATCTEKGTTTYTCNCGYSYTAQDVTALGHDYTEKVTDAEHLKTAAENCQQVNVYWYDCSRCAANAKDDASAADKYYDSEIAGEHSVSDEWTNADGKHFHKCEYCDYTEDEGTCSDVDTDTDHNCDVCDAEGITSHTYGDPTYAWNEDNGAYSCTATKTCSCSDAITETVEASLTASSEATCIASGSKTYTATFTKNGFEEQTKTVTVPTIPHDWYHGVCQNNCGTPDPDYYYEVTIPEALEKADGSKITVSGTVCTAGAWNSDYNNMSVTIVDSNENELYIYRLGTQVALGDIITVKGEMDTHEGDRQIAQGATAEITGHDTSYDVIPEYTIPEALEAEDGTNVAVTGTVVKINIAYNSQYNNISVYIADENGVQLYAYRLVGNVEVGQIIKITGSMATYNSARQIAEGATFEAVGTHICSKYTEATCTALAACVVCGKETGELASHNYVGGVCKTCGDEEGTTKVWQLVKDVNDLAAGDKIVIVANGYNYALSTTQNTNNRAQASIVNTGNNRITFGNDVQIIVLEAGTANETFAFNVGDGYLYAASSEKNYLRTETELSANSSWTISITAEGIATVKANGSNSRNWLRYNSSNNPPMFSCYTSGQADISIYKETTVKTDSVCTHEWNEGEITTPATCEDEGTKTYTCTLCETTKTESIDATGHDWNDGEITTAATCTTAGVKTYTCNNDSNHTKTEPVSATGHTFDSGTCTSCGETEDTSDWVLVTDVSQLKVGDKIVIVSSGNNYFALSTAQNNNNRGRTAVEKNDNKVILSADTQIITLESGTKDGTFAFNVGDGYLYAASDSSNHLKTETTLSDNSSWSIEISAEGIATVKAQGTNTRNWLRYNSSSSIFSCYGSGQLDISIYVQTGSGSGEGGETPDPTPTEFTVTFKDGDTTLSTSTVVEGGKVTEPTAPTKDGYTFDGWFNGETKWDFANNTVTGNITLTAKWTENSQGGGDEPVLTEKTYSYTFTSKQYTANGTKTLNGVAWALAGDGNYWGYDGTKGHQFGSSGAPYKSLTLTSDSFKNVTKIVINTSGASSVNATLTVTVGGKQIGSATNISAAATSYTFTSDTPLDGPIVLTYTQTSSKALYIKSIEVTYAE